jgi:hypothetical protein
MSLVKFLSGGTRLHRVWYVSKMPAKTGNELLAALAARTAIQRLAAHTGWLLAALVWRWERLLFKEIALRAGRAKL